MKILYSVSQKIPPALQISDILFHKRLGILNQFFDAPVIRLTT